MKLKANKVHFKDLGKIDYQVSWEAQTILHKTLIQNKVEAKRANKSYSMEHHLLFAEHNDVYTLGKSGKINHLLLSESELAEREIQFFRINRGGDITYHGEGQITAYPIFDLDAFYHDVHKYVRMLEETVIHFLAKYDLEGNRNEEYTGVWVKKKNKLSKICAIGIHLSRWVTMHGIALNINTDLTKFLNIIPCGIKETNFDVTSLQEVLGKPVDIYEAKFNLKESFSKSFNLEYI